MIATVKDHIGDYVLLFRCQSAGFVSLSDREEKIDRLKNLKAIFTASGFNVLYVPRQQ